jgi:hypothetical protein
MVRVNSVPATQPVFKLIGGKRMLCEDKVSGASPSRLAITDAASTPPQGENNGLQRSV